VFNIAKKYKSKTNDFDGLVQSGFNGLAEAAKRFDITKNIKFVTYAFIWVRKYVLASFYEKNAEIDKVSISLSTMSNSNSKEGNSELEDFVTNYIDPSYHGIKDSN
jgi:RNA polymerase primary sigma factor